MVLDVLGRAIRLQNDIKGIQIQKEEDKLSLFAVTMAVYISNTKNSVRELLQLIKSLSNVAEYVINKKSVGILYINIQGLRKKS